jgi:HD superfamily phosphohydrolase
LVEEGADRWLSPVGIKSFLCAALLHDLGHFPYTHSLKELPLEEHEVLTGRLILSEPMKSLVAKAGGDPYLTAAIVDDSGRSSGSQGSEKPEKSEGELKFYRKLLSGSLDPDKLDYLSRDARYCGVPYGAQDVDFILSRLHPHQERGLDIDARGVPGLESLLFSKYLMYRSVYWHHSVRSATAMVKKALLGALESGIIAAEELYNLDDQGLFSLARQRDYPSFALVDAVRNGSLFSIAAEIPFEEKTHWKLLNISERLQLEKSLMGEFSAFLGKPLGEDSLIIDLPEPVSFECGLFVTDENCFFSESSSAFKSSLVDAFVRSLRIIRVFINPIFEDEIKRHREKILQITQNWLQYS